MQLKSLRLENINSGQQIQLDFKKHNVLIGQKGGGKSTLLNIIYQLIKTNKVAKQDEELLNHYRWKLLNYQWDHKSQPELVIINKKVKKEWLKTLNDTNYIIQSDARKQQISQKIEKQANEQINQIATQLVQKDPKLGNLINHLNQIAISWNDLRVLKDKLVALDLSLIRSVGDEINQDQLTKMIQKLVNDNWTKASKSETTLVDKMTKISTQLEPLDQSKWIDVSDLNEQLKALKLNLEQSKTTIKTKDQIYLDLLKRFRDFNKRFYQQLNQNSANRNFAANSIDLITKWSANYFKLKQLIHQFISGYNTIALNLDHISQDQTNEFQIHFSNNANTINFDIDRELKSEWLKTIFSVIPTNQSDAIKWITKNLGSDLKSDWQEHFVNGLEKAIKPLLNIAIFYDGKWINHNALSGGQKTTYGLKWLLKNRDFELPLLIDQPEEDFDAKTMSTYLSQQLFGKDVQNQSFVVSHMGPLVGDFISELNFIHCDLNNQEQPYQIINEQDQVKMILEGSDQNFSNRINYYQGGK